MQQLPDACPGHWLSDMDPGGLCEGGGVPSRWGSQVCLKTYVLVEESPVPMFSCTQLSVLWAFLGVGCGVGPHAHSVALRFSADTKSSSYQYLHSHTRGGGQETRSGLQQEK